MRLPLHCGKHHGFYPAALAEETLRTGKHLRVPERHRLLDVRPKEAKS